MWYRNIYAWLGDPPPMPEIQEPDFSSNPSDLNSKPVAMDVKPDVAQKAKRFQSNGKPMFFNAQDGRRYLIIHGSPDGYFNVGDPRVNSGDGNPTNNGFVSRQGLLNWIKTQGYNNVNVIACYGGRMESLGNMKSYFKNKGKIGFSTYTDPRGQSKFVFRQM